MARLETRGGIQDSARHEGEAVAIGNEVPRRFGHGATPEREVNAHQKTRCLRTRIYRLKTPRRVSCSRPSRRASSSAISTTRSSMRRSTYPSCFRICRGWSMGVTNPARSSSSVRRTSCCRKASRSHLRGALESCACCRFPMAKSLAARSARRASQCFEPCERLWHLACDRQQLDFDSVVELCDSLAQALCSQSGKEAREIAATRPPEGRATQRVG